jgi:hypothetical protein
MRIHVLVGTQVADFRLDRVDVYLLNHPATDDITKAMRGRRPAAGMTLEQANIVFGEPESNSAGTDETQRVVWCEYGYRRSTSTVREMSSSEVYSALQQAALSPPPKVKTREILATVKDGQIVAFSDNKMDKN